ncbi:MAG TPA: PDZ domain-containing protein, partial [Vicinamibacterales bacterium]|nr:PDZ domain-containing protein [Vicinamibacterales bacterium]
LDAADSGALVAALTGEQAAEYGIQPGDLVVAVNKTRVRSLDELRRAVAALPTRAACALRVLRQGQSLYLAFEIEE